MQDDLKNALEELIVYLSSEITKRFQGETGYAHLNERYLLLSDSEKEQFLDIIQDSCKGDMLFGVLLALYDYKPSSLIMKYVALCIIHGSFPLEELISIEEQLRLSYFLNPFLDRIYIRQIHDYIVKRAEKEIEYAQKFDRESKHIVIMTKQLLGERHATTRMMVNLYQYLVEMGYEVRIVVTNTNKFIPNLSYWSVGAYQKVNSLYENDTAFCINYYGIDVYGYYFVPNKSDIKEEALKCIEMIRGYRPNFIFNCDGFNFVADMLGRHFPVACMGFTKELPTTSGKYIIRYFDDGLTESDEMRKQLKPFQKLFPCVFDVVYTYDSEKKDFAEKMTAGGWKIAIVGNRLDMEVNDWYENILNEITISIPNAVFTIIGECKKLENKYADYPQQYNFLGYVEDLEGALSECQLFINPPRIGGAGAAILSLKARVPVVTLPNCDTASYVGEGFVVNEATYVETVKRYYTDEKYYREQSNEAYKRYKSITITADDSKANISKCISEILNDHMSTGL